MHSGIGSPMFANTTAGGVLAKDTMASNTINRASRLDHVLALAEKVRAQAGNLAERVETTANRIVGMPPPQPTGSSAAEPVADSSLGRIEQTLSQAAGLLEQLHGHLQRLEQL